MNENKNNTPNNNEVHIKQINPRTELTDLERTAIFQFKIEEQEKEEELSKTKQFKILNSKNYKKKELDLPNKKKSSTSFELPKKKQTLTDTIKLKLSDLRAAIDEKNIELPALKQKKSLYDTVIIKLDNIINNNSSLKTYRSKKVTNIEETHNQVKRKFFFKPRDISKISNLKINVNSEEFGRQLYNLNKLALTNLSKYTPENVRKYNTFAAKKLDAMDTIQISKDNYLKYQKKLSEFAINKLYYKLAPKETKKYKLYKLSVIASSLVILLTSLIIVNWFIQGTAISNLSNAIKTETEIKQTMDGELFNINEPDEEETPITEEEKDMYWRYLNTPLSSVDFTDLKKQNKDTIGWLIVNNTNVNYPVVQTTNNDYYLHHAFDRSSNNAGWVYADFRNDFNELSKNTIIYAHGRKDKVMFGSLTNTLSPEWYKKEENQIIQFSTLKYNTMWQIISIYKVKAESYYITSDFSSDTAFKTFAKNMKDRSIYNFGVDISEQDKLLTLSTCYNDSGIRLVIQAKLVKIQER